MKRRYLYLYSGAIGEAMLGIHIGRTLAANVEGTQLEIVSPRPNPFVQELCAELPFVTYRALQKERVGGWLALIGLLLHSYKTIVLETVTVELPLWWRLILWCARFGGGTEVRYQMQGHERSMPRGVRRLSYDCPTENYFDTPHRVLKLWGIEVRHVPAPTLPAYPSSQSKPYILFHFFAGNYKRSIPIDHARSILTEARLQYPNHRFILTCMTSERERAERMCEGMTNTQLESGVAARHMLGLVSGADLVVGTASGILLVAAHLRAPVIAMSCLSDPCWLPTFSSTVTILAARNECRCKGNKMGECAESTPEGDVFRCLYFITTEEVIAAMNNSLRI